jgi:hypothetical protein
MQSCPREIWQEIVGHLAHPPPRWTADFAMRRSTLRNITLVSRSFRMLGQAELLRVVSLTTLESCHRLLDTMNSNPDLVSYVHTLRLVGLNASMLMSDIVKDLGSRVVAITHLALMNCEFYTSADVPIVTTYFRQPLLCLEILGVFWPHGKEIHQGDLPTTDELRQRAPSGQVTLAISPSISSLVLGHVQNIDVAAWLLGIGSVNHVHHLDFVPRDELDIRMIAAFFSHENIAIESLSLDFSLLFVECRGTLYLDKYQTYELINASRTIQA